MSFRNNKKKEKAEPEPIYELTGADGGTLFRGRISELPLSEKTILGKSMEFFQDPEPCYIHRSAVMMRLYTEISDALGESAGPAPVSLKSYAENGAEIERYRRV